MTFLEFHQEVNVTGWCVLPRNTEPNSAKRRIRWRVAKSRRKASASSRFTRATTTITPYIIPAIEDHWIFAQTRVRQPVVARAGRDIL